MAKSIHDDVLDGAFDILANGNRLIALSADPGSDYGAAVNSYMLAITSLASGDFTNANGDTNGRKVTIAQQADVSITNSGNANHIGITTDITSNRVLLITTCTSQHLNAGNTVTFPAFDDEISDPT